MKIAMIASEANPLVKSGGLADVTYSLSRELNKDKEEAVIVLPYYKKIKDKGLNPKYLGYFFIDMSWRHQYVGIFELRIDGIKYYLVDNEMYFNRDELYGYNDDNERFAYFALASLEVLRYVNFKADIIHVHDWQAAIIPCLLKEKYNCDNFFRGVKTVLTIHNPAFKGYMDKYFLGNYFGLSDYIYDIGRVKFDEQVSTLKAGISYADKITTVSPTHRNELLDPNSEFRFNYDLELRKDDFSGVVNGIDVIEFNPETDTKIAKQYSKSAFIKAKEENKKVLLETLGLPNNFKGPVYGLVSRLTWQKGIDLVLQNVEHIIGNGGALAILGSGEKELEHSFQSFRDRFPDRVGIYIGYNDAIAHKVYAGSDFFLMPSLFEPCGIGQLIAQRYGALPIVRVTGGLADTVIGYNDYNLSVANGFSFYDYNGFALGGALDHTLRVFKDKATYHKLVKNALSLDLSWKKSEKSYLDIYKEVVSR